MEFAIETSGLAKTYRGRIYALRGVDLKVRAGCAFGLLGPNGAGKSTLVKTLLSIVHATAGDATLLGLNFREARARHSVGYLPEGHRFPRYLTGQGVCEYFGKLSGLSGDELHRQVKEKLAVVGMEQWAKVKISKYSKGMAQRVGLAQALLGDPKLVFLDEPTDGVDPLGRRHIRDVIKQACAKGTTVFLNSHLLSEVEEVCDQIAVMHQGRILQQGSVADVTAAVSRQGGLRVRFVTGDLTPDLWKRLAERGAVSAQGVPGFDMPLPGDDAITPIIDELRAAHVAIYAVEPQRANLEDAFIDLITAQGGGDNVGGAR